MAAECYLHEIASLRKKVPIYVGLSLIAGAVAFLAGKEALDLLKPDLLTPDGLVLNNGFKYVLPLLAWHTLYYMAENKMSQIKQKVIDYKNHTGLPSPIKYTLFERIMNATMFLHDNRPLP